MCDVALLVPGTPVVYRAFEGAEEESGIVHRLSKVPDSVFVNYDPSPSVNRSCIMLTPACKLELDYDPDLRLDWW